eukprot:RCo002575
MSSVVDALVRLFFVAAAGALFYGAVYFAMQYISDLTGDVIDSQCICVKAQWVDGTCTAQVRSYHLGPPNATSATTLASGTTFPTVSASGSNRSSTNVTNNTATAASPATASTATLIWVSGQLTFTNHQQLEDSNVPDCQCCASCASFACYYVDGHPDSFVVDRLYLPSKKAFTLVVCALCGASGLCLAMLLAVVAGSAVSRCFFPDDRLRKDPRQRKVQAMLKQHRARKAARQAMMPSHLCPMLSPEPSDMASCPSPLPQRLLDVHPGQGAGAAAYQTIDLPQVPCLSPPTHAAVPSPTSSAAPAAPTAAPM